MSETGNPEVNRGKLKNVSLREFNNKSNYNCESRIKVSIRNDKTLRQECQQAIPTPA